MAMESCREGSDSVNSGFDPSIHGLVHVADTIKESEELDVAFLNEFDSYVDDIQDRLTISRMVSDSVIRGMVNAVEQEAADRIAQKELELVRLKEIVNVYHVGSDKKEPLVSLMKPHEPNIGVFSRLPDALIEHGKVLESFGSLKNVAKGQFKNLRKEIDQIRGYGSVRKINSVSELVGLGGILQEHEPENWIDVYNTLGSLRTTLDSVFEQVDNIVYTSMASLCQWQLEQEYQGEVEHMVVSTCIQGLKGQFEERLWDQNSQWYGYENVNCIEKINEISSLRQELDAISKSLSNPDTVMPSSHTLLEMNGDLSNNDLLHQKVSGNHVSSSTSLWEGNGKHGESVIPEPDKLEAAQLTHMSKEELVKFFKGEMTKMKRNHDYEVHEMTEKCFTLRREYLKERGSLQSRKDKEFDALRKRLPDFIAKLDRILTENEKLPSLSNQNENFINLKDRLETLLSENHQLRDLLSDKKKEVNCLSSQVSDAVEKMPQYSLTKGNLLKNVENLDSAVEDAHIEVTISGDVYNCFIKAAISQIKWITEDLEMVQMEHNTLKEIYDILLKDATCNISNASKSEFKDSDLESLIMEGLQTVIFREAFTEAKEKLHELCMDASEKERVLRLEVAEKEKLQQQMLSMASVVDENEKLINETVAELAREKEKAAVALEKAAVASQELDNLRDQTYQQQMTISRCNEESGTLRTDLLQASEELEQLKLEICELNVKLDQMVKDLRESNDDKTRLLVAAKEKEDILSSFRENEIERRKQMESVILLTEGLSKAVADFECRVTEDVKSCNLRLENLSSQSCSLIQMVNILKRKGLQFKYNLERRCSDLEKAESEVDLLGDQVEVLLGLLEKIYIALDHYSPVLKHYPGIMEILKLVRRELSGESTKSV